MGHTVKVSSAPALDAAVLLSAVGSAAVGVSITDPNQPDNPVVFINAAFTRMTGYEAEEVIGQNCRFLQGPDTDRATVRRISSTIATRERCTVVLLNYSKTGRPFWNELTIAPVFDDTCTLTHFVGFQMDVTARVEAESRAKASFAEAQKARAEAEQANGAKSEFLSRMSHELRTPLNSVLGFAQLLELEEDIDVRHQEQIGYILTAGRHLLKLINEVLDIARVEAGRLELEPEAVSLYEIVDETLAIVKPLTWPHNIRLSASDIPEDAMVWADRQRLQQVLLNLISNAVKYNRRDGYVVVSTRPDGNCPPPNWRLEVRDSGKGVPLEKRDKLFQPFERLGADKSEVQGTGLGLAVTKRLVEAMGGSIGLDPIDNVGSTFWVCLPGTVGGAPQLHSDAVSEDGAEDASTTPSKVLYIEDDLASFQLIQSVLERVAGVDLLWAKRAQLGIEMAQAHQPQLVLLDLDLPDMKGEEVLEKLRADGRTSDIPIYIVSSLATPDIIEHFRRAGAKGYFTKPLDIRQFLAAVRNALANGSVEASIARSFE